MLTRKWKLSGLLYSTKKLPSIRITAYGNQVLFEGVVENKKINEAQDSDTCICTFDLRLPNHSDPDWSYDVYFCPIKIEVLSGGLVIGNLYSNYAPATKNPEEFKLRSWQEDDNQFKAFPKINGIDVPTVNATGDLWHKLLKGDVLEFTIRNHTNNVVDTYDFKYLEDS